MEKYHVKIFKILKFYHLFQILLCSPDSWICLFTAVERRLFLDYYIRQMVEVATNGYTFSMEEISKCKI